MEPDTKRFVGILLLIILSPIALLIAYGDYQSLKYGTSFFFETFNNWPWFRYSLVLTIVTSLSAHAHIKDFRKDKWVTAIMFSLLAIATLVLLLYPGLDTLEITSDPDLPTAITLLVIVHAIGFKLIAEAKIEQDLLENK